jgi:hypothetical protein
MQRLPGDGKPSESRVFRDADPAQFGIAVQKVKYGPIIAAPVCSLSPKHVRFPPPDLIRHHDTKTPVLCDFLFVNKEEFMFPKAHHVLTVFVPVLGSLRAIGCRREKDQSAMTAPLPALPQADVAKLKPVEGRQMLATGEVQIAPNAAPDEEAVHPDCAADEIETDYSVKVLYPVTVCQNIGGGGFGTSVPDDAAPNYKVDRSALSSEQQSAFANPQASPAVYVCYQSKGPWQGSLASVHACAGTCNTQNRLTLTNTPNQIIFTWVGAVLTHPSYFQFDGKLTLLGTVDYGRCHPENIRSRATGRKK